MVFSIVSLCFVLNRTWHCMFDPAANVQSNRAGGAGAGSPVDYVVVPYIAGTLAGPGPVRFCTVGV